MSVRAAVAELNKEMATLGKTITEAAEKKDRLIGVRDSLLKEENRAGSVPVKRGRPGRSPGIAKKPAGRKKTAVAKKTITAKRTAAPKKRVLSAAARKKISDAQKKRWAAKKTTAKTT